MADVEITTITIDGKDPKVESITDKATDTMVTDGKPAVRFHEVDGIGVIGMSDDELDFFYSFTPDMKKSMNRKVSASVKARSFTTVQYCSWPLTLAYDPCVSNRLTCASFPGWPCCTLSPILTVELLAMQRSKA